MRAGPPGASTLAGYLTLDNRTERTYTLVGASSPVFAQVEMHTTFMDGDVARMIAEDSVEIPADSRVSFEPGGRHLMLIEPADVVEIGDRFPIVLRFADGSSREVLAEVRQADIDDHHHR